MKKILILVAILFASYSMHAETAREAMQACATAMKYERLDSFQTTSMKATLYEGDQRVTFRIFTKGDHNIRFEQSVMGQEKAYVLTEDDFFRIKPDYEEFDKSEAKGIYQTYELVLPTLHDEISDTIGVYTISDGEVDYGGKKCKRIGVASPEKPDEIVQYIYLDAQTNWLVGSADKDNKQGVVLEGYKKVKGFVYPSTIKIMVNGKKAVEIEINSFEANPELDDALFAKPQ